MATIGAILKKAGVDLDSKPIGELTREEAERIKLQLEHSLQDSVAAANDPREQRLARVLKRLEELEKIEKKAKLHKLKQELSEMGTAWIKAIEKAISEFDAKDADELCQHVSETVMKPLENLGNQVAVARVKVNPSPVPIVLETETKRVQNIPGCEEIIIMGNPDKAGAVEPAAKKEKTSASVAQTVASGPAAPAKKEEKSKPAVAAAASPTVKKTDTRSNAAIPPEFVIEHKLAALLNAVSPEAAVGEQQLLPAVHRPPVHVVSQPAAGADARTATSPTPTKKAEEKVTIPQSFRNDVADIKSVERFASVLKNLEIQRESLRKSSKSVALIDAQIALVKQEKLSFEEIESMKTIEKLTGGLPFTI